MEVEIERRWLVDRIPSFSELPPFRVSTIRQTYLDSPPGVAERVRMIRATFPEAKPPRWTHTRKQRLGDGKRLENPSERPITEDKYERLLKRMVPGTRTIWKSRIVFGWEGLTWELDEFHKPAGLNILEVELGRIDQPINLPPFIRTVREVTDDHHYDNEAIALTDWAAH